MWARGSDPRPVQMPQQPTGAAADIQDLAGTCSLGDGRREDPIDWLVPDRDAPGVVGRPSAPLFESSLGNPHTGLVTGAGRATAAGSAAATGTAPAAAADDRPRPTSTGVRRHRWLRTLDFYRQAIRQVRVERPTLVHANDYNTLWVGVAARFLVGAALVYDAHELWPDRNRRPEPRWWLLAAEAGLVRGAHARITTSPGYAAVMASRYRIAPPVLVRNIPSSPAPSGEAATLSGNGSTVALYVGAVTTGRGIEQSIAAVALVPGTRLRLLGPGAPGYVRQLEELARAAGVEERVAFEGAVEPDQVVDAVRGADVGLALIQPVCLSYELTLPNKLFEYLRAGVPVLGSDLPMIAEFLTGHGVGLVVSPTDVDAIAEQLTRIVSPELNQQLREHVVVAARAITWDNEQETLVSCYRSALAAAGAAPFRP